MKNRCSAPTKPANSWHNLYFFFLVLLAQGCTDPTLMDYSEEVSLLLNANVSTHYSSGMESSIRVDLPRWSGKHRSYFAFGDSRQGVTLQGATIKLELYEQHCAEQTSDRTRCVLTFFEKYTRLVRYPDSRIVRQAFRIPHQMTLEVNHSGIVLVDDKIGDREVPKSIMEQLMVREAAAHSSNTGGSTQITSITPALKLSDGTYDREAASRYARTFAEYGNPAYFTYTKDCTNFISQALYAGGVRYRGSCGNIISRRSSKNWVLSGSTENPKCVSHTWGGAQNMYDLLNKHTASVYTEINSQHDAHFKAVVSNLELGDIIQVKTAGTVTHSTMVTDVVKGPSGTQDIYVSYHSENSLDMPLGTFMELIRCAHWTTSAPGKATPFNPQTHKCYAYFPNGARTFVVWKINPADVSGLNKATFCASKNKGQYCHESTLVYCSGGKVERTVQCKTACAKSVSGIHDVCRKDKAPSNPVGACSNKPADLSHPGYHSPLNPFDQWGPHHFECTRYAYGRAYEQTGSAVQFTVSSGRHGGRWYDIVSGLSRGATAKSNSLGVFSFGAHGHVVYVECVDGDKITFSQANSSVKGKYNGWKTVTVSQFKKLWPGFKGFIYLKQSAAGCVPKVSSVSPTSAILDNLATFTVLGSCLPETLYLSITHCLDGKLAYHSPSKAIITCTPRYTTGVKTGTIRDKQNGKLLHSFKVTVNKAVVPKVLSVSPTTATLDKLATFTILGSNLPKTLHTSITHCLEAKLTYHSLSKAIITCTPRYTLGVKTGTIHDKQNGKLLHSFKVTVNKAVVPKVLSVSPTTATLDKLATFTILGSNLPKTLHMSITHCLDGKLAYHSPSKATYSCTPRWTTGAKAGKIWDKQNGKLLHSFKVTVNKEACPPKVHSVTPTSTSLGKATTFTVSGTCLPPTLAGYIPQCVNLSYLSRTSSIAKFKCTPLYTTGTKTGEIKDKPNGTLLKTFYLSVKPYSPPPAIYAVTPGTATLGTMTTFTVIGSYLPNTLAAYIPQCASLSFITRTSSYAKFQCKPMYSGGTKTGEIKDKTNGTLLKTFYVSVQQPVAKPLVYSVSPNSAMLSTTTTFTVTGKNLPNTLAAYIPQCASLSFISRSSTAATFQCTPLYSAGTKTGEIKDKTNGTVLKTFYVSVKQPVAKPVVYSVSPNSAMLSTTTTFTVTGKNLPNTLAAYIPQCASLSFISRSSTAATFQCTPLYTAGTKTGEIKDKPNGTVLKTFYVSVKQPVAKPVVYSVSPTSATLGTTTTFTVTGKDLPNTLEAYIPQCASLSFISRSSTAAMFQCKPMYSAGTKTGEIKDKTNGSVLKTFYVSVQQPVAKPVVYSVSPTSATLGTTTTFTVTGKDLPSTLAAYIPQCASLSFISRSSTSATFQCKPMYSAGTKTGEIKDKTNGTVLKTFYVSVQQPVAKPVVHSVSPTSATLGTTTTFTVTGKDLPNTLEAYIPQCASLSFISRSSTAATFQCTPMYSAGTKTGEIKDKPNGSVLKNFYVAVKQPVAKPVVYSVSPTSATLGTTTTFTVSGKDLPNTLAAYIPQCASLSFITRTSTYAKFQCKPMYSAGTKTSEIKDKPNGTVLKTFYVAVQKPVCSPVVYSVSPSSATFGMTTTFSVSGTCLPTTLAAFIPQCTNLSFISRSDTYAKFRCKPMYSAGTKTGEIKDKPNGTLLKTFYVAVQKPAVKPVVYSVSPTSATLGTTTTFTVTGKDLPNSLAAYIPQCASLSFITRTSSYAKFQCKPMYSVGTKTGEIKDMPNGTLLKTFYVAVQKQICSPVVYSVSPSSATLGMTTTFTVSGTCLPTTLAAYIPQCANLSFISRSDSYAKFRCKPMYSTGTKVGEIKDKSGGTVLKKFYISVN